MLGILAEEMRIRIRKNENTVVTMDRSEFSACVAGQPSVTHRIDVAGAYSPAHLEARGHLCITVGMDAIGERSRDLIWGQGWGSSARARRGRAALNLCSGNQAAPDQQVEQS